MLSRPPRIDPAAPATRHKPQQVDEQFYIPYTAIEPRTALRASLVRFEISSFDMAMIPHRPPLSMLGGDPRSESTRRAQPVFTGDSTGLTDFSVDSPIEYACQRTTAILGQYNQEPWREMIANGVCIYSVDGKQFRTLAINDITAHTAILYRQRSEAHVSTSRGQLARYVRRCPLSQRRADRPTARFADAGRWSRRADGWQFDSQFDSGYLTANALELRVFENFDTILCKKCICSLELANVKQHVKGKNHQN